MSNVRTLVARLIVNLPAARVSAGPCLVSGVLCVVTWRWDAQQQHTNRLRERRSSA